MLGLPEANGEDESEYPFVPTFVKSPVVSWR